MRNDRVRVVLSWNFNFPAEFSDLQNDQYFIPRLSDSSLTCILLYLELLPNTHRLQERTQQAENGHKSTKYDHIPLSSTLFTKKRPLF